jgi:hypothetical protein
MSKIVTWCAGLAVAGVLAGSGQSAAAEDRVAGVSWGRVIEVPGLAALNTGKGGGAEVDSVSCSSAGNCVAGGSYTSRHGQQAFVAVERRGRWGKATGVPGLAALNGGGYAAVYAVSCAPAGSCAAGGEYAEADGQDFDGFLAVEENGAWGKAVTFPGGGEDGSVDSMFCVSAGNCLAGGTAGPDYFSNFDGFVAQERNGRWGKPVAVPGLVALSKGENADVIAMWCASTGNCAAGGYTDGGGGYPERGFVVSQRHGKWGAAMRVPGLEALNTGRDAQVNSVSCASAGNCLAAGYYSEENGRTQGFAAIERHGRWGKATGVPGLAALDTGGRPTMVWSVSCAPTGRCTAGGFYIDRSRHRQGFVTSEDNGRWGTPIPLPGLEALNTDGSAQVNSVWCAPAGSCAAGGYYTGHSRNFQGFVTQAR